MPDSMKTEREEIDANEFENILDAVNKALIAINKYRSDEGKVLEKDFNIRIKNISELSQEINNTDILIVSTGANFPTITKNYIKKGKELLILDLSMPKNVDISLKKIEGITLINVDELSKITDKTIETRKQEIPITEEIIEQYKNEFNDWISYRKFVPAVNALKESLQTIQSHEIDFHRKKINNFNEKNNPYPITEIVNKEYIKINFINSINLFIFFNARVKKT